jgi:hypothetical protein
MEGIVVFNPILSFDFCGLIIRHPFTIGLFDDEGDLEREELVFFLLLFS